MSSKNGRKALVLGMWLGKEKMVDRIMRFHHEVNKIALVRVLFIWV